MNKLLLGKQVETGHSVTIMLDRVFGTANSIIMTDNIINNWRFNNQDNWWNIGSVVDSLIKRIV